MTTDITIYHNPACGTSRTTLERIRAAGFEPTVIEYLTHPPTRARLGEIVGETGGSVRAILREKAAPYDELGLAASHWRDEQLLDFMIEHPILINRPIVVTPLGTRLCRPAELVDDILPGR